MSWSDKEAGSLRLCAVVDVLVCFTALQNDTTTFNDIQADALKHQVKDHATASAETYSEQTMHVLEIKNKIIRIV